MQESIIDQQVTDLRPDVISPSSMNFEALEFALELAVIIGDSAEVQTLLSNWPQGTSYQPLHSLTRFLVDAIKANDPRIVELLLAKETPFNLSHVQLAIDMRSDLILQKFLEHGWNINECADWATPPTLSLAIHDEALISWFLDHGANPNTRPSILDCTPLSMAILRASVPVIELLFNRGGLVLHGQLLHYAVSREGDDRLKVLDFLLSKQAPGLNEIMYQNSPESFHILKHLGLGTPLHLAADKGHTDVVRYLLGKGVDPEIKDSRGRLAIDRAKRNQHSDIVEILHSFSTTTK